MKKLRVIALVAFCAAAPASAATRSIDENDPRVPQDERQFAEIFSGAQAKLELPKSASARAVVRLEMQMHAQKFMNPARVVQKWIGVVEESHLNPDGTAWIRIAVPGGASISTLKSREDDPNAVTLVKPSAAFYPVVDRLRTGTVVVFDTILLGAKLEDDETMVDHPDILAIFTNIEVAKNASG